MEKEPWKVLWLSKTTGEMRSFIWHDYHDNELNQRILFINDENDKTLTIYYDDIGYMITAPYEP